MAEFKAGDRAKVKGYTAMEGVNSIAGWEGVIVEVRDDPAGYVILKVGETGYNMGFQEDALEKV